MFVGQRQMNDGSTFKVTQIPHYAHHHRNPGLSHEQQGIGFDKLDYVQLEVDGAFGRRLVDQDLLRPDAHRYPTIRLVLHPSLEVAGAKDPR